MKPLTCIVGGSVAMLMCGCPSMQTTPSPRPEQMAVQGAFRHRASGIVFPEIVGPFKRDRVLRYNGDSSDLSAGYMCLHGTGWIRATAYIYPAPRITSIGSPPDVIARARAELTETEYNRRKQEVLAAHRGVSLIEERDIVRTEEGTLYRGKLAMFDYEEAVDLRSVPVRSELFVFCYIGGKWAVEYRFTYPKAQAGGTDIQEFIDGFSWHDTGT